MESSDIRWMLAALFIAFLIVVVLSDVARRRRSSTRHRPGGFRAAGRHARHGGWRAK